MQNYSHFINIIRTSETEKDEVMASFDVKSLFTSIPLDLTLEKTKLVLGSVPLNYKMDPINVFDLIEICVKSASLMCNGKIYQQISTAMGSLISTTVAEMQWLEQTAIASPTNEPVLWRRYIDDVFVIMKKKDLQPLWDHLKKQNPNIQFTLENEAEGKHPFLDVIITRKGKMLQTSLYRKPTPTGQYLNFGLANLLSHKASVIRTLVKRAITHCSDNEDRDKEIKMITTEPHNPLPKKTNQPCHTQDTAKYKWPKRRN